MIIIIDYGLGNLFSVAKALQAVGAEVCISSDPKDLLRAERIVLPGVGAFQDGIRNLEKSGWIPVLSAAIREEKKPFLGICLGLQLLADKGFEHGECAGLGIVPGVVRKVSVEEQGLKVPHIGWNEVAVVRESPLFSGIKHGTEFYFVHSYQFDCADPHDVMAIAEYGTTMTAAILHDNIVATQFHPEKSQDAGLKFLENFVHWTFS